MHPHRQIRFLMKAQDRRVEPLRQELAVPLLPVDLLAAAARFAAVWRRRLDVGWVVLGGGSWTRARLRPAASTSVPSADGARPATDAAVSRDRGTLPYGARAGVRLGDAIADLDVSPDGTRIAFTGTRLNALDGEPSGRVSLAETAGGEPQQLTAEPHDDRLPRWSPDGSRIAFLSDRVQRGRFQAYPLESGQLAEAVTLLEIDQGRR